MTPPQAGSITLTSPAEAIDRVRSAYRVPLARAAAWAGEHGADAHLILTRSATVRVPAGFAEDSVLVLQVPGEWPVGLLLELALNGRVLVDQDVVWPGDGAADEGTPPNDPVVDAMRILEALGFPEERLQALAEPLPDEESQEVFAVVGEEVPLGRRLLLRPFLRRREPEQNHGAGGGSTRAAALTARASGGRVGLQMPAPDADAAGLKLWAEALIDELAAMRRAHMDGDAGGMRAAQQRALLDRPRPGQSLIATGCAGSGTCVSACPMGALERPQHGSHFSLELDAAACVECGVCVEHCPENALDLRDGASWGDALGVTLAVGALQKCARCGMPHGRRGDLCAVCSFRRENPNGMWLPPGFVRERDRR